MRSRLRDFIRSLRFRRTSCKKPGFIPMELPISQELAKKVLGSANARIIAVSFENDEGLLIEDPFGVVKGLSKHWGVSRRAAFIRCVEMAQSDLMLAGRRLFFLDEIHLGKRCQKMMISPD